MNHIHHLLFKKFKSNIYVLIFLIAISIFLNSLGAVFFFLFNSTGALFSFFAIFIVYYLLLNYLLIIDNKLKNI